MKIALIALTLLFLSLHPVDACAQAELTGRASVIDGDTIEIRGTRVRLWAIDAPESSQLCQRPDGTKWRCGSASANALASWIGNGNVRCIRKSTDRYGRMVAACDLAGNDLGRWMVSNGWALAYRRYSRDYIKPEVEAANSARGIHASYFVSPWEFRRDSVDRLQVRPRTSGPRRTQ